MKRDEWLCGYAAAMANINRLFDMPSTVASAIGCDGLTLDRFRRAGVEDYDMEQLRKCITRTRRNRARAVLRAATKGRS